MTDHPITQCEIPTANARIHSRMRTTRSHALRPRAEDPARRRRQPGPRLQGGGAAPLFIRRASRRADRGRRRQHVHRLRDVVGAAHPRPRAARPGARRWLRPRATAPASARRARSRSTLGERVRELMPALERVRFVNSGTEAAMSAVRVARAATRPRHDRQVRRVLSRPRRLVPGEGRIGRARRSARRPAPASRRAASADTLVAPYNDLTSVERVFDANRGQIAAVIVEPIAGNMGVVPPADGFLRGLRELCTAHGALLIFDEVISGFRAAAGRRAGTRRRAARPDLPRQDHRRRPAGRRLWRPRRPDGAGVAGRAGVSGGHAVGQSAGDDGRPVVAGTADAEAVRDAGGARRRGSRPGSPMPRATPASRCRSTPSARC